MPKYLLGKKRSPETIEKMRKAKLKNPTKYWLGKKRPEVLNWLTPIKKGQRLSPLTEFQKGHTPTEEQKNKMQLTWEHNRNVSFETKNLSYRELHKYIENIIGKPDTCEHCGKTGLTGRKIHWANKSRKYKKELSDWIRLCVKCHKAYDKQSKILV